MTAVLLDLFKTIFTRDNMASFFSIDNISQLASILTAILAIVYFFFFFKDRREIARVKLYSTYDPSAGSYLFCNLYVDVINNGQTPLFIKCIILCDNTNQKEIIIQPFSDTSVQSHSLERHKFSYTKLFNYFEHNPSDKIDFSVKLYLHSGTLIKSNHVTAERSKLRQIPDPASDY